MPRPRKGEKRQSFVSRAMPIITREHPEKTQKQCLGQAYGMWDNAHPGAKKRTRKRKS